MGMLKLNAVWFACLVPGIVYSMGMRQRSAFWSTGPMAEVRTRYDLYSVGIAVLLCVAVYGAMRSRGWAHRLALGIDAGLGISLLSIATTRYVVAGSSVADAFLRIDTAAAAICLLFGCALAGSREISGERHI